MNNNNNAAILPGSRGPAYRRESLTKLSLLQPHQGKAPRDCLLDPNPGFQLPNLYPYKSLLPCISLTCAH
jgi:hypothetical protein